MTRYIFIKNLRAGYCVLGVFSYFALVCQTTTYGPYDVNSIVLYDTMQMSPKAFWPLPSRRENRKIQTTKPIITFSVSKHDGRISRHDEDDNCVFKHNSSPRRGTSATLDIQGARLQGRSRRSPSRIRRYRRTHFHLRFSV